MERPIIVPVRRLDTRNSMQLPGHISPETLFGSSPLFLKQFQNHNGEIDSLTCTEIPVIKPRNSLSPQYTNNTAPTLALAKPAPRTQRTIFFRNEDLLEVEDELGMTPVPKPRPRSTVSPNNYTNPEFTSWVHVNNGAARDTYENSFGNPNYDQSSYQYCQGSKTSGTAGKRKMTHDTYEGSHQSVLRGETSSRSQKKPRHEISPFGCSIL